MKKQNELKKLVYFLLQETVTHLPIIWMILSFFVVLRPIRKFSGFTSLYIKCRLWTNSILWSCNSWQRTC